MYDEEEEDLPPEDFRFLSVVPTVDDFYGPKPYLRPCQNKEPYNSVEHYLDVQFRLLREDFFQPLRKALQDYLSNNNKKDFRSSDIRLYKKVKILPPEVNKNQNIGIKVYFGKKNFINWRTSKRFMYRSLLMLSHDNFGKILFATVSDRDTKMLENGYILVEPCLESGYITNEMYTYEYIMLESKVYFEPYLQVLSAMKCFNLENFPMKQYLVDADTQSSLPKYLRRASNLKCKTMNLPIQNGLWPLAHQLNLDDSQYNAFKHALTEELAIIQGPPGTGKTFIALEIVSTLVQNKNLWRPSGPIVIVCYTNHALDQFLEGILISTKSIVRIGSKSKSEKLQKFTLQQRRQTTHFKDNYSQVRENKKKMYEAKKELEALIQMMAKINVDKQRLETLEAIVPIQCLKQYTKDRTLASFQTNTQLITWLLNGKVPSVFNTVAPTNQLNSSQSESSSTRVKDEESVSDEEDGHQHMDDELELETVNIEYNDCHVIYPLKIIDSKLELIARGKINSTKGKSNFHKKPIPSLMELNNKEERELLEARKLLEQQLNLHPSREDGNYRPIHNQQWRMYWTWIKRCHDTAVDQLNRMELQFRELSKKLSDKKNIVDLDVLKKYDIIGLTTTCAARLQSTLRELRAPIVLVEEAAEIFEAHVLCTLTNYCQHLIMIGDHKQLRPKPSVYELGVKYKLNLSLFERMINIRGNCNQLAHQHRMRPEIAKLITPSIYDKLYNHQSVYSRPNIKGLDKNVFFLHHTHHEIKFNNEDSWANDYEVKFLIALANYLVQQEYAVNEITVLCTYTGQMFALKKEVKNYSNLKDLYVTTVDNFQGEENKIILLSLVRNNDTGNIGFLKEENRVCVALSRARDGMFIMGNMNDLLVKNNIWPKIKQTLVSQNAFDEQLHVRCQIHADQTTLIRTAKDFEKCPGGGCLKQCNLDLTCGHVCDRICHVADREHKLHKCEKKCNNSCPFGHPCPLKCWQKCLPCNVIVEKSLKCGHTVKMKCSEHAETFPCYIEIHTILPNCKHSVLKPCYISVDRFKCPIDCDSRLPCGHACNQKCHITKDPDHIEYKCTRPCPRIYDECNKKHECKKRCFEECGLCPISVTKKRSCGHFYKDIACSKNVEDIECTRRCERELSCNHKCKLECHEVCKCLQKVQKVSSCGHTVKVQCFEEATPSKCTGKCPRKLEKCGHPCQKRCKDQCTLNCEFLVKLNHPGLCGHLMTVPCHVQFNSQMQLIQKSALKYCDKPCMELLECGHRCKGTCGKCYQGRIHVTCQEPCQHPLICGHPCQIPCRKECQPCKRPCEVICKHSKCTNKCGVPCVTCKEECDWGCEHRKCSKKCGDLCDVEPCMVPCKKILKCGHPCVGFCGDPCPPLCRLCNSEELTTIVFGNEDEPDARFVYLEDCKHCIESDALMQYMQICDSEIALKVCPLCKTPIKSCMRIMNQVKTHLKDVIEVKRKFFYRNRKDLKELQLHHCQKLRELASVFQQLHFKNLNEIEMILNSMLNRGASVMKNGKKQELDSQELDSFGIQLQILSEMFDILTKIKGKTLNDGIKNQILLLCNAIPGIWLITKQTINDIQRELRRFEYMVALFKDYAENRHFDYVRDKLSSIKIFTPELEKEVRNSISHITKEVLVAERKMIVAAMAREIKSGAWYKCPNGHFYAIGECGGAMQQSKCPECGSAIGGSNHRITTGNTPAPEMDGSYQPAWPGQY
ncbi:NFX1-type zinc finger-containing protein 1-like [Trichogramma pretiosum]|uniref:NFX1-type zinc finger-containing protein 1-like n=1 Tax=Trichogramma pretiosum TaxID=7493 RepID=UPI000C71B809|nr:NFX1-type zinc finger-containing protein 1-like [Trichogramma pretiosum]XP_023318070.1 NFX1-type zinc finger-containing protein 1-like [Trichogramma pretiosum]XP_023318071.1 NFX1-type zinc finger-containing protein 1-like [Trichogramma pretiosum]